MVFVYFTFFGFQDFTFFRSSKLTKKNMHFHCRGVEKIKNVLKIHYSHRGFRNIDLGSFFFRCTKSENRARPPMGENLKPIASVRKTSVAIGRNDRQQKNSTLMQHGKHYLCRPFPTAPIPSQYHRVHSLGSRITRLTPPLQGPLGDPRGTPKNH